MFHVKHSGAGQVREPAPSLAPEIQGRRANPHHEHQKSQPAEGVGFMKNAPCSS